MKKEKICKQCGEIIDKNSKTCLRCGADQRNFFSRHQVFTIFMVVFILICIAIGIIFNKLNSITKNSQSTYTQSEFDSIWGAFFDGFDDISTTAEELAEEYEDDEYGTDDYLLGECIEVTGVIENVKKIDDITLRVNLKTDSDYKLYCYFDKDYNEKFEELEGYTSGRKITTVGYLERNGKKLKLTDCILGDWESYYSFDNNFDIDVDIEALLEDIEKNDQSMSLSKDNIMSFDSDVLDYGYSYEEIINIMSEISQGEVKISEINEKNGLTNKTIEMKVNGKETSVKLSKDPHSFDKSLVYVINRELKESNSDRLFYCADMAYYCEYEDEYGYEDEYDESYKIVNIAYSTEENIEKMNKILKDSNLEIDEFKSEADTESI